MTTRNILAGLAITTLVLGSASAALAAPHYGSMMDRQGGYCGMGGAYNNMTPEMQANMDKLVQDHVAKVEPLRQKLDAKQLELSALAGNPNAKPEAISKLAEEIASLNAQLRKSGQDFRSTMEKETGLQYGPRGMGMGMGGMHHGERGMGMRGMHHERNWR